MTGDVKSDLRELAKKTRSASTANLAWRAIYAIESLSGTLNDCKNELCTLCGEYTERYKGACAGCKWR